MKITEQRGQHLFWSDRVFLSKPRKNVTTEQTIANELL